MDGQRSIARIAEVIRQADADIVCLQEVHQRLPWSGFQNQPGLLERMLGIRVIFGPNYGILGGRFGNAIATSHPIKRWTNTRLPNELERRRPSMFLERRGLLEVELTLPDGPLTVMCTHWSLAAEDRMESAVVVADRIRRNAGRLIVCGDLNARPGSPEMRHLVQEAGLVDAGADTDIPTYPADWPTMRIDYILHPQERRVVASELINTQASDHQPVLKCIT
jgi:endonuclease/exonuclease/phosphatase family metal-dependent hydrolase